MQQACVHGGYTSPLATPAKLGHRGRRSFTPRASANPAGNEKFDYVIVGGGTAGCILANRLTADGTKKVLVLEAGGNGGAWETRVPAALSKLFRHPTLDWNLFSTNQQPLGDRQVYLARGKTLGGSSATNATLYLRGTPADYDSWGLDGWRAQDVLSHFVGAECNKDKAADTRHHSTGGSMNVENPRYQNPLHEEFFRAAAAAGFPSNPDFNDWSRPQAGYGEFQVAQKRGQRADAFTQYLQPALGRPNLRVVTGARTTRVATETGASGARAVGVEFAVGGAGSERHAAELAPSGEVIMCSGTVANPQLLMLSGVGPAEQLRQFGIPLVAEAAGVGSNLQDHPATLVANRMSPEHDGLAITSQIYDKNARIRLGSVLRLLLLGDGPLASTACDHGAFLSTSGSGPADLQIRFVPGFALDPDAIQSYVKFAALQSQAQAWPPGITMQLLAVRPRSRGTVRLASTDPFALPSVDLNYFGGEGAADLATLVKGVAIARRIAEQAPLARYLTEEGWPGVGVQSDSDIADYVRGSACSGNALVGTCRMGSSPADGSVVSCSDFGVWGVRGLRVVDASVMPVIPAGQTGAPTVMVAERAAALLTRGAAIAGAAPGAGQPALV